MLAGIDALPEGSDVRQVFEMHERIRAMTVEVPEPENVRLGFEFTCECGRLIWSWTPTRKCEECS